LYLFTLLAMAIAFNPLQHHCRVLHHHEVTITQTWVCRLYDPFWRFYRNRDAGAVIISDQGEEFPMRPGECLIVPAWGRFNTRCSGPVRHTYVHFDPIGLPGAWVREHCTKIVPLARRPDWDELLDAMPIRDSRAWVLHLRCQAMLCDAMALAIAAAGASAPSANSASHSAELLVVQPALEWIDRHIAQALPVDQLARRCAVSRDHFTRIFTRATGVSPARYVAERRITATALKLLSTDDSIEDIAESTGFTNRYHFSRVFQRILRTSPAAYRRQGRLG